MEKRYINRGMLLYCVSKIKNGELILLLFLWVTLSYGQTNLKKELPTYIEEVDSYFENGEYHTALNYYLHFYRQDSSDTELNYKIAICMFNLKQYKEQALSYLQKVKNGTIPEVNYYLGRSYQLSSKFNEAIASFNLYKNTKGIKQHTDEEVDLYMKQIHTAIEMIKNPVKVDIKNMGDSINSKYPDYVPLISADESMLIFTSRRAESTGRLQDANGDYFEDVYVSHKKDSSWTVAKGISKNINSNSHDACVALAPGGEKMIIYRTNEELTGGDLYLSTFNGEDWSTPKILQEEINAPKSWQTSACFTTDENIMYFSSNREGGYGGKDLYKVVKLPNGKWSKPTNLGNSINTNFDEDAPFVHPDGQTLYFSSKGHENMGGYDIFKCTLQDNGKWSPPENIGYPINSVDDDIYFVLSTNEKRGYYSSYNPSSYGGADIYVIHFPEKKKNIILIKGNISSSDISATKLAAEITITDKETKELQGLYNSNRSTGNFLLVLKPEKKYIMTIKSKNHQSYTQELSFNPSEEEVTLKPIKLDKK